MAAVVLAVLGLGGAGCLGGERGKGIVPPPAPDFAALLDRCERELEDLHPKPALESAFGALELRPGDEAATLCRNRAMDLSRQQDTYDAGRRLFETGDVEGAYRLFAMLPRGSPYRARSEVHESAEQLAEGRLSAARAALEEDPGAARRVATSVFSLDGIRPDQREAAAELRREAEGLTR